MYMFDGKTAVSYSDKGTALEAHISKDIFPVNVPALSIGYYDYRIHEYPPMRQEWFGNSNTTVYDIDFNNFFLRAYQEYLTVNNITHKPTHDKLNRILSYLNDNRNELKQTYLLLYHPKQYVNTVSNTECKWFGYGQKPTQRELKRIISSITGGEHINKDSLLEIMDKTANYSGYYVIINRYHFLKYKYLSGIGWIKRKRPQLWYNIMKHASQKMWQVINTVKSDGHKVYNCYIDSIQSDINVLKKYPELFEQYPAKEDKTGSDYGLCLPPSYWIDYHIARWLCVDYKYWFKSGNKEGLLNYNTEIYYLKKFVDKIQHPLSDLITVDFDSNTISTDKLPKLDQYIFEWDFIPEKTECLKAEASNQKIF